MAKRAPDGTTESYARLGRVDRAQMRLNLGEAGRRYVEASYRLEVVLDRYRALIEAAARA